MKEKWDHLINYHVRVSKNLTRHLSLRYNNALYSLIRYHLRQLKEEYNGYGCVSGDVLRTTLPPDYTDDELLHYSNFTKEWNQYLKRENLN